MPWPYELGLQILDPYTNMPKFWPWPNRDWLFNKPALDAVAIVHHMNRLMQKSGELWTDDDNKFYKEIHKKPEAENGRNHIAL